jgi:threonine synthase
MQDWPGLIEGYRQWLPVSDKTPVITLREGATPLIPAPVIAERIGKGVKVFLKYDGLNPTGSFKDRGMTMAISKAKEAGSEAVICASTGNTSAAAAAYARRGGMRAFVLIPDGYVAQGKLAQALLYGAEVLAVKGNFDRALAIVQEVANQYPITLVNSVNPYRLQGQKTAAFEVVDALGEAPDWLCIPVGNAGNISAYWMGFNEYKAAGHSRRLPRMMGFQAAGSAPLVLGHTVESNGDFMAVTDAEIIEAYKLLGAGEGVFCEPASAASVAGLIKRREQVPAGATVVCVLTGNGLKDPTTAIEHNDSKFHTGLEPDTATVACVMGF